MTTITPAQRLAQLPPYFFDAWNVRRKALQDEGHDIIRMDAGSPDMPPPPEVVEAFVAEVQRTNVHGYPGYGGILPFRQAWADYYAREYGAQLDAETQVEILQGSKEGVVHLSTALLEPGDLVLAPDPGYSPYERAAALAGGVVRYMPLLAENDFLPDLDALDAETLDRAKLLWLNYPNNPTTALAPRAFYEKVLKIAHRHNLLICHDAPYLSLYYTEEKPLSLLSIDTTGEYTIEFNSLSKTYNMAGWRSGVALGNAAAVQAVHDMKSNIDSGQWLPVQQAGIVALEMDSDWVQQRNAVYAQRARMIVETFNRIGIETQMPRAAMYVWACVPDGYATSFEYAVALMEGAGVSITAGTAFGGVGEGYFRVSLGIGTERMREALQRWEAWAMA